MTSRVLEGLNTSLARSPGELWLNKDLPHLGKSNFLHFCQNLGFSAITFNSKAVDSQSRALKTRILA